MFHYPLKKNIVVSLIGKLNGFVIAVKKGSYAFLHGHAFLHWLRHICFSNVKV